MSDVGSPLFESFVFSVPRSVLVLSDEEVCTTIDATKDRAAVPSAICSCQDF